MGSTNSIRRITFENKFALGATKSMEECNPVIHFDKKSDQENRCDFPDLPNRNMNALEMLENDNVSYWSTRIDELKKEHEVINNVIDSEYKKALQETNKLYETPKASREKRRQIKPCVEWRSKIIKCYEENHQQPLMCSALVKSFNECVASYRLEE